MICKNIDPGFFVCFTLVLGEVGGSSAKGSCTRRNRSFKGDPYRKEKEEGMEEDGYKSLFCWRWLYQEAS